MSTNKKFRIQNGVDIHGGGLSIDDVVVIGADGKVVPAAIADAVAGLTSSDIADLQAQVSAILGTSPETLDTLQEIVAAFEGADSTLTGSVAQNAADIATINTTLTNGVATPTDVAGLQSQVTSNDTDIAANAAAIAATNARTSGISTSSGSSNIQMTAEVDMDGNAVTNMADPTAAQDAATKAYVDAASTSSGSDLSAETAARIAGDAANSAEVTAAIATASADATSKANAAETAAKAHADQVVAATVDAAPAALDTLNELAAALGDDANFASTVTASIATKADDAATTAALATKEDKTTVTALDTFVKGGDEGYAEILNTGLTVTSTPSTGFNYFPDHTGFETGVEYRLAATLVPEAGHTNTENVHVKVRVNGSEVARVSEGPAGGSGWDTFTLSSPASSLEVVLSKGVWDKWRAPSITIATEGLVGEVPLDTTATQVVPAINELHTELNALSSTQSGDQSNLQTQITAEVARASSAEAVNAANIVSETSARTSADAALESDIISLQNQVGTIIQGSPASLDTLVEIVSAFETADASLSGVITANGGRLTTAENNITALEADLTAEENARGAGDASLQSQITSNDSDILANASAISAEETRATGVESSLQAQITSNDADISALQGRSGTIEGKDADQDVAIAANASAISAEVARATAAEGVIASDLADEVSRATSAEAALQSSIDFVKQNTDPAALDSLTEIVAAFQAADGSITSVVNSNTTRISSLEGSVTGIEAWNTDNVSEGSTNLYFTDARAKASLTGGLCITYNSTTGEIKVDEAEAESALRVAESVASDDADKLDGQQGSYYRINIYNVAGTLVN